MTERISFTKYEHDSMPLFREKMNKAETMEDVKKIFSQTMRVLLGNVLAERVNVTDEDVVLRPGGKAAFILSERLLGLKDFETIWKGSDLPQVFTRFAQSASGRYRRLEKKPEKTETRIRM